MIHHRHRHVAPDQIVWYDGGTLHLPGKVRMTQPQHMKALDRANYIRLGRAEIKRDIAAGRASAIDVLEATPEVCETMTLWELLRAMPRWGTIRTRKFLWNVRLPERKRLITLTSRQKRVLIDDLRLKGVGEIE